MLRLLIILLVLAGAGAFLTKPSEADIRTQAHSLLRDAIEDGNLDDVSDPALAVLLLSCKSDASACADLLMQGITLTYDDRTLYARVDAEGFGKSATCYAAYTQLICPDGLIR